MSVYSEKLLDDIAGITAQRDVELLEFSLLKSVENFLNPRSLRLLKLDQGSLPRREVCIQNDERVEASADIEVSEQLENTLSEMEKLSLKESSFSLDGAVTTVFLLLKGRNYATYAVFETVEAISSEDNYLIEGMLTIFRNFCELLLDAQTDELTGLANRKTFDFSIRNLSDMKLSEFDVVADERRLMPTSDERFSHWLAIVDIDHFKKINDRFGHIYGDEVLVALSQRMRNSFREHDMLFRFGGEEFVIILKSRDMEGCAVALERFREAIREKDFSGVGRVTVSIGATRIEHGQFHVTLLDYADQALYHSKNNGRDKVTFFDELVELGTASLEKVEAGEISLF